MRTFLDLLDVRDCPVLAEVTVRLDTVELRCRDHLVAVADREQLRSWLYEPTGYFTVDDVTLLRADHGVAMYLGDVVCGYVLGDNRVRDLFELLL